MIPYRAAVKKDVQLVALDQIAFEGLVVTQLSEAGEPCITAYVVSSERPAKKGPPR
jgi:hypothetical protein